MSIHQCRLIRFSQVADPRGNLNIIEGSIHIPFNIARFYYVYNIPSDSHRGGHAHRELEQLLIPMKGAFDVILHDGREKKQFRLDNPDFGLYIPAMIWVDIKNFTDQSLYLAAVSLHYDEKDYYRNYDEFLQITEKK